MKRISLYLIAPLLTFFLSPFIGTAWHILWFELIPYYTYSEPAYNEDSDAFAEDCDCAESSN